MQSRSRSREEWAVLCREQKASGLPTREFAERFGVNARTLAWWRSRLRTAGAVSVATRFVDVIEVVPEGTRSEKEAGASRGGLVRVTVGAVALDLGTLPPASWVAELARSC